MNDRSKLHRQSLRLVAAAVLLALGSPLAAQERAPVPEREAAPQVQQQEERVEQGRWDDDQRDSDAVADRQAGGGLDQLIQEREDLSSFVEAVRAAGMEDSLTDGMTTYTIFAPTNDAFRNADADRERLQDSENWQETADLLRAHIVADDVNREMAQRLPEAMTLDGGSISLSERDGELMAGDARVVAADIQVGNLRVYAIDAVLQPSAQRIDIATGDREAVDGRQDRELGIGEADRTDEADPNF